MYRNSIGGTSANYHKLFVNTKEKLSFTQEFGTLPPLTVFKALSTENAIFNNSMNISEQEYNKYKDYYNDKRLDCRRVFYLQDSVFWKKKVLEAGVLVFDAMITGQERK